MQIFRTIILILCSFSYKDDAIKRFRNEKQDYKKSDKCGEILCT